MTGVTTHILDTSRGRAAAGIPVRLEVRSDAGEWTAVSNAVSDPDGRATLLDSAARPGTWRLTFDTASYFDQIGVAGFYPEVQVVFRVRDAAAHHHVPLLLSPFGYSTYRGS